MSSYLAECTVRKDLDPALAPLDRSFNAAVAALQRIPRPDGAWLVSDGIWQAAAEFKNLMEKTYQVLDASGALAMDPDEAPPGVPPRMEYSTFCRGWVPHLRPTDADRMLAMFGLTGEYARVTVTDAVTRKCGVMWRRAQDPARGQRRRLRVLRPQAGHRRRRDTVPDLRRPTLVPGRCQPS